MTKIQNISVTLPTQLENLLLSGLIKGKDKEIFLREELERLLVDKMVEELDDFNAAEEAHQDYINSGCESISWEELKKECNL